MKTLRIKNGAVAAGRPSGTRVAGALRLSVVAAGALLVCAVSCKKDDGDAPAPVYGVRTFHATSEGHAGDGKTTLHGTAVWWETGDAAAVQGNSDEQYYRYVASGCTENETDYHLDGDGSASGVSGSSFCAIYPYSAVSEKCTFPSTTPTSKDDKPTWKVSLPKYQIGTVGGTFASGANVMAAMLTGAGAGADNLALEFKNLCGVLRLRLAGESTVRVKSILVVSKTATDKLWGDGTVTFGAATGDSPHKLGTLEGGDNSVWLAYRDNGVPLKTEGVEFDIVLPEGCFNSGFELEVYCEEDGGKKGMFFTGTSKKVEIKQNQITAMTAVEVGLINYGMLPGRFSVTNGHVHFSQGNLQFHTTDKVWRFAEQQYERIDENETADHAAVGYYDDSNEWIDLLGWGTSNHNHNNKCWVPWSTGTTNADYYAYSSTEWGKNLYDDDGSADWGCNRISNGGDTPKQWRTPNKDDFEYIFKTSDGTSGRSDDWMRYAKAEVVGVPGVLVFPDGTWKGKKIGDFTVTSCNTTDAVFTTNNVTEAAWSVLESLGVVFLPCAGDRNGAKVSNVGSYGNYWSSTAISDVGAYGLGFSSNSVGIAYISYRYYGRTVRLVR